ncbi:MAG: glutathione S-transferase family protein [Alphaproteobacteria bacterium]|jgi:glutathione S-transferase|nr:glutathione S-transferase family protein [Alphaproteobacteria bacterium]MDP6516111.1 glutathione S-transferase family protein [Alphaproteobacteria bacterium]
MSKLKIYGIPASRAFRCLWMAHELGLDFELVPIDFATGAHREASYVAVNPNAKIPAIDDDGLVLWESMAINLYLAKKHGQGLWPETLADEARAWQWSFWVMTEIEKPLLSALFHRFLHPKDKRDPAVAEASLAEIRAPLAVLDAALDGRDYLLGGAFSVADLNVAAVLSWARLARIDLSATPALDAWLGRCLDRPAAAAASPARPD